MDLAESCMNDSGNKKQAIVRVKPEYRVSGPKVSWVLIRQLGLMLVIGFLLSIYDIYIAAAFIVGGSLHVFPNTYFALRTFLHMGAQNIRRAYISTNQGLVGKMLLTATGFALVYKFWPAASLIALFIGYMMMQVSSWVLYPILINSPLKNGK